MLHICDLLQARVRSHKNLQIAFRPCFIALNQSNPCLIQANEVHTILLFLMAILPYERRSWRIVVFFEGAAYLSQNACLAHTNLNVSIQQQLNRQKKMRSSLFDKITVNVWTVRRGRKKWLL